MDMWDDTNMHVASKFDLKFESVSRHIWNITGSLELSFSWDIALMIVFHERTRSEKAHIIFFGLNQNSTISVTNMLQPLLGGTKGTNKILFWIFYFV